MSPPFPPLTLFAPGHSVTAALAARPSSTPGRAAKRLFPKRHLLRRFLHRFQLKHQLLSGREWTAEELTEARQRGQFGDGAVSDLFLAMYADVLTTLKRDTLGGNVSPALLGCVGVVTCSVVSAIPDIMLRYRDCIVMAEREVILQTNYWQPSNSVNTISNALRTLSARIGARGGPKVVVKIMWDRGDWRQVFTNHVKVEEKTWVPLDLPSQAEVPHLSLEVINFHRVILGTFHQKLLIVDRKVALLNSNNIQDRPNVEMMVQLEGPVVDSLYDVALISWSLSLAPPLPCVTDAPMVGETVFGKENRWIGGGDGGDQDQDRKMREKNKEGQSTEDMFLDPAPSTSAKYAALAAALNAGTNKPLQASMTDAASLDTFRPVVLHDAHEPVPMAVVGRKPHGLPGHQDLRVPQDAAWLAAFRFAKSHIFIQTPTLNARPLKLAILSCIKRGVTVELWLGIGFNDQSESLAFQGGTNLYVAEMLLEEAKTSGRDELLKIFWYTAKDQSQPVNALEKSRNCHVKFLSVDSSVAILGNGNQDSQSWFHSQECNLMIDSPSLVAGWEAQLRGNQNTGEFGRVGSDGVWRDGKTGEGLREVKKKGAVRAVLGLVGLV